MDKQYPRWYSEDFPHILYSPHELLYSDLFFLSIKNVSISSSDYNTFNRIMSNRTDVTDHIILPMSIDIRETIKQRHLFRRIINYIFNRK